MQWNNLFSKINNDWSNDETIEKLKSEKYFSVGIRISTRIFIIKTYLGENYTNQELNSKHHNNSSVSTIFHLINCIWTKINYCNNSLKKSKFTEKTAFELTGKHSMKVRTAGSQNNFMSRYFIVVCYKYNITQFSLSEKILNINL